MTKHIYTNQLSFTNTHKHKHTNTHTLPTEFCQPANHDTSSTLSVPIETKNHIPFTTLFSTQKCYHLLKHIVIEQSYVMNISGGLC